MKTYFADTNIFLRFLLPEITQQKQEAEKYFKDAKEKKIIIILCQIVVFEICFALEKYYQLPKQEVYNHLKNIISTSYFVIEERENFLDALEKYKLKTIDFVDAFLFCKAANNDAQVLSFDKDFKKLDN